MKKADVLLDTIGFSGMNTAMQAIGCGLPIITRIGNFQRTRHASAILKTINVEELITNTEEEYINLMQSKVKNCKKFIFPFGFLSASAPMYGPVSAITIPQTPAVHCQYAAPSCGLPTI